MSSSTYDTAYHYCVSHIPAATIPASRLSNILDTMRQGRPLTAYSLAYLEQQNLTGLYQLATGQINYEAYIADLDPDFVANQRIARAKHKAQQEQRLTREANAEAGRRLRRQREREASEAVLKAQRVHQAELAAQRERDREAALKAQRVYQAELAAQRERNREAAAAAYLARASDPDCITPTPHDIASYYHVNHIPSAVSPPLSNILDALFRGYELTDDNLNHLKLQVPSALHQLALGQITFDSYIAAVEAAEAAETARQARVEAANAARIARESDPDYIDMMQTRALYTKYGFDLNDQSPLQRLTTILQSIDAGKHLPEDDFVWLVMVGKTYFTEKLKKVYHQPPLQRLTTILQSIDAGNRLPEDDFVWLKTVGKTYFTEKLQKAYHQKEAEFYASEYRRTQDPWNVVNASGHYRKCDQPDKALDLLDSLASNRLNHPKIKSAVCTTRGGVMRDLGQRSEALQLGEQAHKLRPRDFRPCTLLGAVHMELGNFDWGREWYEKAAERGASEHSIDTELRSIYQRADKPRREAMKAFLLAEDPERYRWVNDKRYQDTSVAGKQ